MSDGCSSDGSWVRYGKDLDHLMLVGCATRLVLYTMECDDVAWRGAALPKHAQI